MAAGLVGGIYFWGQGVAIDYPVAFKAYKVSAEGGEAISQHQLGYMYNHGRGVPQDFKQARASYEKAAAQDEPNAVGALGLLYDNGKGVTPSWRRAREYYKRAIQLGNSKASENMDNLNRDIQQVIVSPKVHVFHSLVHPSVTACRSPP